MKFIIGKKLEMSQRYRPTGEVIPVTVVKAEPCTVTQIKSGEKDGYVAVQIGTGAKKHLNKPAAGHLGPRGSLATLREFRVPDTEGVELGSKCDVSVFEAGDQIQVTGYSKGKGFQGVVKRHGFKGSPASHGHKDQLRMPGSIGATGPAHVFKGTKMGGRMGGDRVTIKNLEIIEVEPGENRLVIKGAVPGARGSLLLISGLGDMKFIGEGNTEEAIKEETSVEGPKEEKKAESTESKDSGTTDGSVPESLPAGRQGGTDIREPGEEKKDEPQAQPPETVEPEKLEAAEGAKGPEHAEGKEEKKAE